MRDKHDDYFMNNVMLSYNSGVSKFQTSAPLAASFEITHRSVA